MIGATRTFCYTRINTQKTLMFTFTLRPICLCVQCLKEAYVKCTGLGIGGGDKLTDLDFEFSSAHQTLAAGQFAADTRSTLRGQPLAHMRFEETVVELPNARALSRWLPSAPEFAICFSGKMLSCLY